jgi:putative transposase
LPGTFGKVDVAVPRNTPDGKTTEWKSRTLRTYQRHTLAANAPIAGCFSPPPHTLARSAPCCWRGRQGHGKPRLARVKSDWDAWNAGSIYAASRERIETRRNAFIRK